MSTMFGENHRPTSEKSTTQHGLEKWRVLMGMQNLSPLALSKCVQSTSAGSINSWLTVQMFDDKAVLKQSLTNLADLIQHCNNAAKVSTHASHHLIDQHLCATHTQRVNDVADRRSIVDGCNPKMSGIGLDHDCRLRSAGKDDTD
jgi:hypothetical protein